MTTEESFCFGAFTLDLRRGSLRAADREIDLRPKSFELLRYLVENAGRLVSKGELIRAVWPGVVVTDESVTRCVSDVRLALQDQAQRIIKTVPRRGYMLAASVSQPAMDRDSSRSVAATPPAVAPAAQVFAVAPSGVMAQNENARDRDAANEMRFEPRMAERRQLTVLACELVGLAALSAELDPEDLREVTAACHKRCVEIVERQRGCIAHYSGDGVLAYFGYAEANEYDAERAVQAGLALVESFPQLPPVRSIPFAARVGIATGLVVVDDLAAAGAALEKVAVGKAPHLAAGLQALAEPGAVVISSGTRSLTGGLFDYRDLGAVALRGFAETVPAWQVLGASVTDSRFEALRATTTPLVGRDAEIERLLRCWEQAKGGAGGAVLISGDPGIGKSRIAKAILERLSGEPHTRLRYFCSPHYQDSALYPIITQLARAAGLRRDDTDQQRLEKLERALAAATHDPDAFVPLLADLLSIPTGGRYPELDLTPQKRKRKTLRALLGTIEGLAAHQAVLMVCEDIHWSDPTTLEVLDLLIDRVATLPVLIIITFRPEFAPSWVGHPQVTWLSLSRLPVRQRAEMIGCLTGGKLLPKEIADQIIDRTDGVPLFIEELTKAVVESGLLVQSGGRYLATGPAAPLAVPTSLHESLLARLNHLGPTRVVAQIGSALGRQFSHELISAVAAMPRQQLDDALVQLVHAGVIFQRGMPPEAEYTFKHALLQDAIYGTMLRSQRRPLHARVAATLEAQFPEVVAAEPALLARHCAEGALAEKAVVYWLKAGRQAAARSAMTEAVARLQKGLDVLSCLPEGAWRRQWELELHIALRPALTATKGYSATVVGDTIARARVLAEQMDRSEYLPPLLLGQWAFHGTRSEHRMAMQLAVQLESIGATRNDATAELQGRRANGRTHLFLGKFATARALLERCHGLADPAHRAVGGELSVDPYSGMLADLAVTLAFLGYIDQARLRMDEALSEARRVGHAHTLATVLALAYWLASIVGSSETQRHAGELLALSTEHGFPLYLGWATVLRGRELTTLGRAQEGVELLMQGLSVLHGTGCALNRPLVLMWLAEAYTRLGQPVEGLNSLAEAAEIIESTEERVREVDLHRLCGDLLDAAGDPAAAEQRYRQALEVARSQSAKLMELRTCISLARLWCKQGKGGDARDLLASCYDWFVEGFGAPILGEAGQALTALA